MLDTENDSKMIKRENIRLKLAIEQGINQYGKEKEIIAFMHYPPITKKNKTSEFIDTLKQYGIKNAIMDTCMVNHIKMQLKDALME